MNRKVSPALSARCSGTTLVCGSVTPGLIAAIRGSFQEVMDPWYISASTLPFSFRWVAWPQARDVVVDLLRGDRQRDVEHRRVGDQVAAGQVGVGGADVDLARGGLGDPLARTRGGRRDRHVGVLLVIGRRPAGAAAGTAACCRSPRGTAARAPGRPECRRRERPGRPGGGSAALPLQPVTRASGNGRPRRPARGISAPPADAPIRAARSYPGLSSDAHRARGSAVPHRAHATAPSPGTARRRALTGSPSQFMHRQ